MLKVMKDEKFTAGYRFVKCVRVGAYVTLAAGLLATIGLVGWHTYEASASMCDLKDAYKQARAVIDQQKKELAEFIAANDLEAKQKEEAYRNDVDTRNANIAALTEEYNGYANEAVAEIKKVSSQSSSYAFNPFTISRLETVEACESHIDYMVKREPDVNDLHHELYKSIYTEIDAMMAPIQNKRNELLAKIAKQQQYIAECQAEIEAILNSYKATQITIIEYPVSGQVINTPPLYNPEVNSSLLHKMGNIIPNIVQNLSQNEWISQDKITNLSKHAGKLAAWLPVTCKGSTFRKEEKQEVKDPNPDLTPEHIARIEKLRQEIARARGIIADLVAEINPLEEELNKLSGIKSGYEDTKSSVLSGWKVGPAVQSIVLPVAELRVVIELHAVEMRILLAKHLIAEVAKYDAILAAEERLELAWQAGCRATAREYREGLLIDVIVFAGSWVVWSILLILMDFAVSRLVVASRSQDIQHLLESISKQD